MWPLLLDQGARGHPGRGEGLGGSVLEGAGPQERYLCPRGFLPVLGPGDSANTASSLGGGASRVPETASCPSGLAETAGVKAKSREHVRAEGHLEEGKRGSTAPAPHPARAKARGHGQHSGAACRDPCPQAPGPTQGIRKKAPLGIFVEQKSNLNDENQPGLGR